MALLDARSSSLNLPMKKRYDEVIVAGRACVEIGDRAA